MIGGLVPPRSRLPGRAPPDPEGCLKSYLAREIYRRVMTDRTAAQPIP